MKRTRLRRDWSDAEAKRGPCRVCGETWNVELAHLSAREYAPPSDKHGMDRYVRPESVIPLCGPATTTTTCHGMQHAGVLDLVPYLSNEEAASVVLDLGLQAAYTRLGGIRRDGGLTAYAVSSGAAVLPEQREDRVASPPVRPGPAPGSGGGR